MLPESMLTSREACQLPPADTARPVTDDRLRNARAMGQLTARQDPDGRRTWRYLLSDLVASGFVSPAVYAVGAASVADLEANVKRLGGELSDLRAEYRFLREFVTRLNAGGGV
jgi:hypothetical protein